jgi:hypothetical protein
VLTVYESLSVTVIRCDSMDVTGEDSVRVRRTELVIPEVVFIEYISQMLADGDTADYISVLILF